MEIYPGVHRLNIPIPNNPLGIINAYLIKTEQGCMLIDTGWKTDEAFDALSSQMQEAGVRWADLRTIVITHAHPDHYGLAGRLVEHTQAELVIHELELTLLRSRYEDVKPLLAEMNQWLRINGVPDPDRPAMQFASLDMVGLVTVALPNRIVHGGEHICLGDWDFEILWTPGHAAGHICLYERSRRLLFSGDHVLPKISPSVGMHVQSVSNPLVDYQNALQAIQDLDVEWVFPSHGDPFQNLNARVAEILHHHEGRMQEVLQVVDGGRKTAFEIAGRLTWSTSGVPWEKLRPFIQRMAVTETLAHTELLAAQRRLAKHLDDGVVYYSLV